MMGGVEARGRKEGRRAGEGGSGAEASRSRGFLVPRGACELGLSLPVERQQAASTCKVAPLRTPQVSRAKASLPHGWPAASSTGTTQAPVFAGSGRVVRG